MEYIKIQHKNPMYPKRLLQIKNYPKELYILGNYELLNKQQTVAIIGSRDCTEYGRKYAYLFAEEISKKDICIISGLAIGIDTIAHIGAVENKGKTIAVLGGGFNKFYPKENEWLFNKILQNDGCIITEYAPDIEPDKRNFPKRNRIVSGLSDITLVIEAEHRSGTSITAGYAKEQSRIVCAIPGNLENSRSIGTNRLIKEGAELIMAPYEIIEILKNKEEYKNKQYDKEKNTVENQNKKVTNNKNRNEKVKNILQNKTIKKEISKEYEEIYNLIKEKPIHINNICKITKKNMQEISVILTILELEGLIESLPGNEIKVKEV